MIYIYVNGEHMKCIMKKSNSEGLVLEDMPIPTIKNDEVLVKVKAASICGSDHHIYKWNRWAQSRLKLPVIIGHEFSGEVIEVGSAVKRIKVRDYISAESHIPCCICKQCRIGNMHVCQNLKILGIDTNGCFAEYVTLPETVVWVNDNSLSIEHASIQEPFGNAVDTVLAEDVHTKSIAVLGCGPIGLMAVAIAKACGASIIIATEIVSYRMNLARQLGADYVLNPKECNVYEEVMKITGNEGVDVVLEMSGAPKALETGLRILTFGGRVSLLGLFSDPVELELNNSVIFKGARIHGIVGRKMFPTWYKTAALIGKKMVNIAPLITHTFPMESFNEAMQLIDRGESGKIVLYP
ncbi:MAG: L-threonine 3-dehydrogenase [Candidatus Fischerbacteria bacterium RBG_13_37_8]|uniref:L-threonine 3-dehydrogenase n=1 Tax=Candidatus Fischerbacteria bacterium RBG_13_37_8 TaxID=1817863 RepID=A0A1F5VG20_9BACT|nr:MAG: L-threonine 3-dehydrogenase [Candidatus Fischerbacteria bacterium RBG_13_37_8]